MSGNVPESGGLRHIPRGRLTAIGIVVALLVVGVLIFAGVKLTQGQQTTTAQSTSQPPPPPDSYAIPGCYNPAVQPSPRPKKLNVLGCASVAVALQDMSWSSWGPQGADGTGTAVFKLCDPNCATGAQLREPVVVHAWNAQKPRSDAICVVGLKIFGDMILAFPKDVPPPNAQQIDTQYNGMPAVHYVNYSPSDTRQTEFIGYTFCN
nr:hypothetical protein MFLOJ_58320 [Mycobacterium florentinum]